MPIRIERSPAPVAAVRRGRGRALLTRTAATALLAGPLALGIAGCSSSEPGAGSTGQPTASGLPSVAASAASAAASSVQSAASALSSAAASAFGRVAGGIDARGDIKAGAVGTADGRAAVPLTVRNSGPKTSDYVIETDFRDRSGNLLDVAVVTVKGVAPGSTVQATAKSNRSLTGDVTAVVARAVRY